MEMLNNDAYKTQRNTNKRRRHNALCLPLGTDTDRRTDTQIHRGMTAL